MAFSNEKLPPIVDSFQPTFVCAKGAKIYFSPSSLYNTETPRRIHYTLKKQNNNENVFNSTYITCGINILDYDGNFYAYDADKKLYYIYIPNYLLAGDGFQNNTYYKIQIRYDNGENDFSDKANYLIDYVDQFTEWSTSTLIKPISRPKLTFSELGETIGNFPIVGKLTFADSAETEVLDNYTITITSGTNSETIGPIYQTETNNKNEINYNWYLNPAWIAETSTNLNIRIDYNTTNGYSGYALTIPTISAGVANKGTITAAINDDRGIIQLSLSGAKSDLDSSEIWVRRASSVSNFKNWELFYYENIGTLNGDYSKTVIDNTVQSNSWYKYSLQIKKTSYSLLKETDVLMPQFDSCFISDIDKQLELKYNFKISSIKPVSNITKLDTLGSKYPKFAQNPLTDYNQYSITALISAESDPFQTFFTINDNFDETLYDTYKQNKNIWELVRNDYLDGENITTPHAEPLLEREFRKQVIAWLKNGNAKLLRNQSEGNKIVMITEPSITPNAQLDNMICEVSMTAYEIGDGESLTSLCSLGLITDYSNLTIEVPQPIATSTTSVINKTLSLGEKISDYYSSINYAYNLTLTALGYLTIRNETDPSIVIYFTDGTSKTIIMTSSVYQISNGTYVKDIKLPSDSYITSLEVVGLYKPKITYTPSTAIIKTNTYSVLGQYILNSSRPQLSGVLTTDSTWIDGDYKYTRTLTSIYGADIAVSGSEEMTFDITYINNAGESTTITMTTHNQILNLAYAEIITDVNGYASIEEYNYKITNIKGNFETSDSRIVIITYLAEAVETKTAN